MPIRGDEENTDLSTISVHRVPPPINLVHDVNTNNADSMFEYPVTNQENSTSCFQKLRKSNTFKGVVLMIVISFSVVIAVVCTSLFFLLFLQTRRYYYYFKYCSIENQIDFCNSNSICQTRSIRLDSNLINSTFINEGNTFIARLKNNEYQLNISRPINSTQWRIEYDLINQIGNNITVHHLNVGFGTIDQYGFLKIKRDSNRIIQYQDYWLLCFGRY